MSSPQSSPLSVRECLLAILRHWKLLVCVYAAGILLAIGFLAFYPKTFVSSSKMYVRMGRENIMLDPTVTASQMVMVQKSQENEINSLLDVLESRWMAEQVVDAVGVQTILSDGPETAGQTEKTASFMNSLKEGLGGLVDTAIEAVAYPMSDRDRAIKEVQENIAVYAPKQSTVITVTSSSKSPEQAQRITEATTDIFMNEHLQMNRTQGTLPFFREQSAELHDELMQVREKLRDRKNEFGMLSIDGAKSAIEEQISAIELEACTTDRELAAAQTKATKLQEQFAQSPPQISTSVAGVAHEAWDKMRDKLYGVELSEIEADTKYTEKHPFHTSIEQQREQAERVLEKQPDERTQVSTIPNPTHQALELDLRRQLADVAGLQSSHDKLTSQLADLNEKLKAVNSHEVEIADLERRADLLETNYRTHSEKLEQARIDDALQNERITSLNVVQPATLENKPASPKRAITLFSALVLSTFVGFGLALVREYSNPQLQTAEQVESVLDLPVLATIPRTKRFHSVLSGGARTR